MYNTEYYAMHKIYAIEDAYIVLSH